MQHTWNGTFNYDEGDYGKKRDVTFVMNVELEDGSFYGTWKDEEYSTLSDEPGQVKGFIDEDLISFILKYPINYTEEANGGLKLDSSAKPYEIQYDGFFDERSNEWEGNWEFEVKDENGEYFLTGSFKLNRDSEALSFLSQDLGIN